MAWNPTERPYRVRVIRPTSAPGCHGWASATSTHATLDEACATATLVWKPGIRVDVQVAENAETWTRNGRWKTMRRFR